MKPPPLPGPPLPQVTLTPSEQARLRRFFEENPWVLHTPPPGSLAAAARAAGRTNLGPGSLYWDGYKWTDGKVVE